MRIETADSLTLPSGRPQWWVGLLIIAALNLAFGCGQTSVVPPVMAARQALETALNAWKDGKTQQSLTVGTPVVNAVDSEWANGKKLASFEIVREEPSDSDKRFVVVLKFVQPDEAIETSYIVIGLSPITVFRKEDYERGMAMDNNPISRPARQKKAGSRPAKND